MKLTGSQTKQLREALIGAFPASSALEQMVRFALDENLNAIATGNNLSDLTFALIGWAETRGRLPALINGAHDQNPDNPELKRFVQETLAAPAHKEQAMAENIAPALPSLVASQDVRETHRGGDNLFTYDIFLSHSSVDKPAVRALAERLRADGLRVWFDEWVIQPGDMIGLKIEEGLQQSRTLALCMSENAFASEWVKLERHTLLFRDPTNSQRRFIPLRLDNCTIPAMIAQFAYVDWRTPNDEAYTKLRTVCQPPPAATPPPPAAQPAAQSIAEQPSAAQPAANTPTNHQSKPSTPDPTGDQAAKPLPADDLPMIVDDPIVLGFGPINAIAVTPDGRYLIGSSLDSTVKVWERSSGRCLATLEGHEASVWGVAVTPDGSQIVSSSSDRTVKIWERSNGHCVATLEGHGDTVVGVAVTSDGSQIISGSLDRTVKVWERSNGHCLTTLAGHGGSVLGVTVTPDGT